MAESKEHSTMINCIKQLEIALESNRDITQFLLKQGFISPERYDEINSPKSNRTDAEKAHMLVSTIRNQVALNPHNYHIVVNHMRQNIRYRDIIEILDMEYQRYPGFAPEFCPPAAPQPQPGE